MPLSKDQESEILQAVNQKIGGGSARCPLCGRQDWAVENSGITMVTVQVPPLAGLTLGGPVIPAVILLCRNCGDMHFLSLSALGLGKLVGV